MLKLMAIGDVHLGRVPSLRAKMDDDDRVQSGPETALRLAVDAAIAHKVQAVLFAGDLVESESDFFEGFRVLEKQTRRLLDEGIRVIAVGGNHDCRVLPRLAEVTGRLELLGRGDEWESVSIEGGGDKVEIWGWSFPKSHYEQNPLAGREFPAGPHLSIGLLHADLDASASRYAPVSSADLRQAGLDGWLLGHIHRPDDLSPEAPVGYLGSLCPLDATETGIHGPVLLEIESGKIARTERLFLGPLSVLQVPLDITGTGSREDVEDRLAGLIREEDDKLPVYEFANTGEEKKITVAARVRLIGRSDVGREAAESLS
ncbi:MAG: DNA repair exonuclease, partial [Deltaproteobacteria bacterium]